jgi:hypothetical protein
MDESYDDQSHVEDAEILDDDIPASFEKNSEPSELNIQLILLLAAAAILIGKTPPPLSSSLYTTPLSTFTVSRHQLPSSPLSSPPAYKTPLII